MKIFVSLLLFTNIALAQDLVCQVVGEPTTSDLKVEYNTEGLPESLYLRSPNSEEFRKKDLFIEVVSIKAQHLFSAKPKYTKEMVDWSNEKNCFKEVGTLLYFNFDFATELYFVSMVPNIITKNQSCIPPRFQPQTKQLSCNLN